MLAIVPLAALAAGFAVLSSASVSAGDWDRYERYREFWGGNPAEVYSHWLDMVLMSGNAAAIAWLLSAEAFCRRNRAQHKWLVTLTYACAILGVVLSGAIALVPRKMGARLEPLLRAGEFVEVTELTPLRHNEVAVFVD